jgi:hypothetical protein
LLENLAGTCYQCCKSGHQANDCLQHNKKNEKLQSKFKGKCDFYRKKGYKVIKCWHKKRDERNGHGEAQNTGALEVDANTIKFFMATNQV